MKKKDKPLSKFEIIIEMFSNFGWYILFPSMFLIIVLMGAIDSDNTFMPSVKGNLSLAGVALDHAFTNTSVAIVAPFYYMGTNNHSEIFLIILFLCCIGVFTLSAYNLLRRSNGNR